MENKENILQISKSEQYRTIEELLERSRPNSIYYTLLMISVFIVAGGLLLNNGAIVIGGMLVTPVLTPILAVALGSVAVDLALIKRTMGLMLKSFGIIIAGSFVLAFVFGVSQEVGILENTFRAGVLYFIVALASGAAATFAWVRKDIAEVLPGIAIAVSLVPPLSLAGIQLSVFQFEVSRFYFIVFIFNLIGILLGSFVVFTLLKFSRVRDKLAKKTKELDGGTH